MPYCRVKSCLTTSDTGNFRFIYDSCTNGLGRLCTASDGTGSTSYTYTPEGRLAGRGFSVAGTTYALGYGYDAMGHLATVNYPDGHQAIYSYADGVVSGVTLNIGGNSVAGASAVSYRPGDLAMAGWTSSNGLSNTLGYDSDGRLTGISVPNVQSLAIGYDKADRVASITNSIDPGQSAGFDYDDQSRLTGVYGTANTESYAYDADGNRIGQTVNGASTGFNINATNNRLMGVSGATTMTYGYDAQGNTTAVNGVTVNQYDPFNRLSSASGASDYVNPEGHRLRKASSAGTTYFAPEGDALLAENDNGTWIDYVWLNGRLIGRVSGSTVNAIHDDQTGRPQVVTDAGGAVVWKANNYPFTQAVTLNNIGGLNLGFPGQYYDAERGTWNNGYRDYDPSLGRYIESDPVGLVGGVNTYAYVHNNPIQRVDPMGLDDTQCMYNHSMCGMNLSPAIGNASVGLGASGNLFAAYGSVEVGGDVDSTGTMCVHAQMCEGGIAGLPVQGVAGVTGSVGTGAMCSGTQVTKGVFVIGGAGVVGDGQITGNSGGFSVARGLWGVGGSPEGAAGGAGALVCTTRYWCTK